MVSYTFVVVDGELRRLLLLGNFVQVASDLVVAFKVMIREEQDVVQLLLRKAAVIQEEAASANIIHCESGRCSFIPAEIMLGQVILEWYAISSKSEEALDLSPLVGLIVTANRHQ